MTELPFPRRPEFSLPRRPESTEPAGTPVGAADAPGGRWQPHRAGILNVWRYYDETFTFHQGRLLLRGQNGSGKSKALEGCRRGDRKARPGTPDPATDDTAPTAPER
ncbi:hypothetical protein PV726_29555 [Streptomyces europaeiscabiei]|nr:hypothetical protein [Streptomyces europaeiscabiei]MDX3694411.1 hypothetical protein [Streptomyces europaeiscabiei]